MTAPPAVPQPTPAALAALDPGVSFLEMIREYAGALQREPGSMHHIESLNRVLEYVDGLHTQLAAARRGAGDTDVPTDLVHEADGLLSLVAYRYRKADIPDDLRDELIACSLKFRRIGEERKLTAAHPEEPQHGS